MEENQDESNSQGKKELFLDALDSTRGMIAPAAEKAGISRSIVYVWEKNDAEFRKKVREIKKSIPHLMEERLILSGYGGNFRAMVYYLERNHPKYRKRNNASDTEAHIYHHVEGRSGKNAPPSRSLEEQLYDLAQKRKDREERKQNGQA